MMNPPPVEAPVDSSPNPFARWEDGRLVVCVATGPAPAPAPADAAPADSCPDGCPGDHGDGGASSCPGCDDTCPGCTAPCPGCVDDCTPPAAEAEAGTRPRTLADEEAPPPPPGDGPPNERTPVDEHPDPPEGGVAFRMPIAVLEGWETADHRYIEPGALGRRALPWTCMAMRRNPDGGWGGHDGAIVNGRIDTAERFDASATINPETGKPFGPGVWAWTYSGWLIQDTDETASTVRYVRDRVLRGLSVDISEAASRIEITEEDEDGWPIDFREIITAGALMGGTICPFPAFPGATIELDEGEAQPAAASARPASRQQWAALGARPLRLLPPAQPVVAAGGPLRPPAAWFDDPQLPGPTRHTVTDDGRTYGHYACWGTRHRGVRDRILTPEQLRNATGEAPEFHVGPVRTAEGTDIRCGALTMGIGHAPTEGPGSSFGAAVAHYDNTDAVVADVRTGYDGWGMWYAGAVRPGISEERLRAFRAARISGDWRERSYGAGVELLALLCVNVEGFPIPEVEVVAASGHLRAVVAAGIRSVELATTSPEEASLDRLLARHLAPVRAQLALQRIRGHR